MSDAPATTTVDIATRDGVGFRRRKRRRKIFGHIRWMGKSFVVRRKQEVEEATYHGGKSMLRAWFGKGLLKRKVSGKKRGGAVSEFVGHKRRRYVVTKQGGGRYTIGRRKK
jgi:hypothetical protein